MTGNASITGIPVDFIDYDEVWSSILAAKSSGVQQSIVLLNPHSLIEAYHDPEFREAIKDARFVLPDGIGMIWAAKVLGCKHRGRITGPALLPDLLGRNSSIRHCFWGGAPGVAAALALRLRARYPRAQITGSISPPFGEFDATQESDQIERINRAAADVVWFGVGAPKQEKLIARWRGRLSATTLIGVGAAFDFHAGNKPWAPPMIRALGLEWLFRLAHEPRRLWRRNLDSPLFVAHVLRQKYGNRPEQRMSALNTAFKAASEQ